MKTIQDENKKIDNQASLILEANSELKLSNMSIHNKLLLRDGYKATKDYCPEKYYICDKDYSYRTISGVCNNLFIPWWGKAVSPFTRILEPEYDDGFNSPKTHSKVKGEYLPNAREVAIKIHHTRLTSSEITHFLNFFYQFVNQDILRTTKITTSNGKRKNCASCSFDDPECINIPIPPGDFINNDQDCIPLSRSAASVWECDLSYREQLNDVNSWLDLGTVYGNNIHLASKLRTFKDGLLIISINPTDGNPALPRRDECPALMQNNLCFLTGDVSL